MSPDWCYLCRGSRKGTSEFSASCKEEKVLLIILQPQCWPEANIYFFSISEQHLADRQVPTTAAISFKDSLTLLSSNLVSKHSEQKNLLKLFTARASAPDVLSADVLFFPRQNTHSFRPSLPFSFVTKPDSTTYYLKPFFLFIKTLKTSTLQLGRIVW